MNYMLGDSTESILKSLSDKFGNITYDGKDVKIVLKDGSIIVGPPDVVAQKTGTPTGDNAATKADLIPGVPNWAVWAGGGLLALTALGGLS